MNDSDLHHLLQQWRDIEPRSNFEANVRRRLRQAAPEPSRRLAWIWQPAFSVAAAVFVAFAIGTWTGLHSRVESTGFLDGDTLTGRYLELTSGGHR